MFKFRDIELVSEFFDQEYNLSASDIEYIKKQIVIKKKLIINIIWFRPINI